MNSLDVIIPLANLVPTSHYGRIENINYALQKFYAKQTDIKLRVIFVEQSLDGNIYYLDNINTDVPFEIKLLEINYEQFNKPWCQNVGFNASESECVMFADCDIIAMDDYFSKAVDWFLKNNLQWAFAWSKLYYTDYLEKRELTIENRTAITQHTDEIFKPSKAVNEGGFVLYRRDFYKDIGCGNEFIKELGGPDNEQAFRALHKSKTYEMFSQFIYHLEHEQTPKSFRPTRLENIMLYREVAANPDKAIDLLKKMNPGSKEKPYCYKNDFYKLMSKI